MAPANRALKFPISPVISSSDLNNVFDLANLDEDVLIEDIPKALREDLVQFAFKRRSKKSKYVSINSYRAWVKKIKKGGLDYDIRISKY